MGGNKNPLTRTDQRGDQRGRYPLDPVLMVRVCRKMAADLRAEAAAGNLPPIRLTGIVYKEAVISRAQAAVLMDQQADRCEEEAGDGPLNVVDRERIGL